MKVAAPGLRSSPVLIFVLSTAMLCFPPPAAAQAAKRATPTPAGSGTVKAPVPLTRADVETFLDILVPLQLERADIAGAVVAVVKDGAVLFEKGYGYADVQAKRRVSATDTLFRAASVSKLFTATAVMQLVEQGKLGLDRDVNEYLDFRIPPAFAEPIMLRHLLTHTAGFEWRMKDFFVRETAGIPPMSQFIPAHLPARVFPPGHVPAYSNLGVSLAGYIVERASGQPFEQYMEDHILQPLEMKHSTFRQPLPPHLAPLMSKGYRVAGGEAPPAEVIGGYQPAASLVTSADDMTRFMLAHLGNGRWGSTQILRPETAALMHARQPTHAAGLNAMALGFYEESSNGRRIIGHSGDTMYFHSDLHLIPSANLGFFVSYNSAGSGGPMRGILWEKFLARYFPWEPPAMPRTAAPRNDARAVAGSYITTQACRRCPMRLTSLIAQIYFAPDKDGNVISGGFGGPFSRRRAFEPIAPLVFREVKGQELIAFRRTPDGQMVFLPDKPVMASYRARWYENQKLILVLLLGPVGIFAATLLLWPVAALVRRHYQRPFPLGGVDRRLHLAVRLICLLNLTVLGLWALWASQGFLKTFNSGYDAHLHALQALTGVSLFAGIIPLWPMMRAWRAERLWWWSRVFNAVVVLACGAYTWFILTAHLLDWSLGY